MVAATILEAAEAVFAERGIEARLDEVAARAGVAVGTLYNYFRDRQALVEAMFEAHRERLRERLERVIDESTALPFRARLETVLVEFVAVSVPKLRIRLLLLQAMPSRELARAKMRERFIALIGPMLHEARTKGEVGPDAHGVQADLLLGMLHSLLAASQEPTSAIAPEAIPKVVVAAFLDGVGRPGDSA